MSLGNTFLAACVAGLPTLAFAQFTAPAPEDLIIYHVFIDRFENGDRSNDDANPRAGFSPANGSGFHGGDLEGARQRLPYIAGLGANGIWLSPMLENVREYHGYATFNWYNVEPNFGTLAKLKQFINEANDLGIAVYFDMVAGHCGTIIDSAESGFPAYRTPPASYNIRWNSTLRYPAPFNNLTYFHAQGEIGNFNSPEQELGELAGLDDLKTETVFVQDEMTKIWTYWIENTGVSGFRIDTVKHVDLGFWRVFLPRLRAKYSEIGRANYFTFGEIFGGDDGLMRTYIRNLTDSADKLDAAVDFQFYYTSNSVFARADSPPSWMTGRLAARESSLGRQVTLQMPNFIDNHDLVRFMNCLLYTSPSPRD